MAIGKLKRYKLPGIDQIPAELIKAGGSKICSEIHNLLISFGIKRYFLSSGRSQSLYQFIRRVIKHCSNYCGISLLSSTYKILSNILLSRLTPCAEEIIGNHQCGYYVLVYIPYALLLL
jgi:hypothetical protein